jgi:single-strand DNA-binding protein
MNTILLSGTIQRDPETKFFESGRSKTSATLAVRQPFKTDGKYLSDYFDLVIWAEQGERFAQQFTKGKPVEIVGSMHGRTYEKDGQKRKAWEVNVQRFNYPPKDFSEVRQESETSYGEGYDADAIPF